MPSWYRVGTDGGVARSPQQAPKPAEGLKWMRCGGMYSDCYPLALDPGEVVGGRTFVLYKVRLLGW